MPSRLCYLGLVVVVMVQSASGRPKSTGPLRTSVLLFEARSIEERMFDRSGVPCTRFLCLPCVVVRSAQCMTAEMLKPMLLATRTRRRSRSFAPRLLALRGRRRRRGHGFRRECTDLCSSSAFLSARRIRTDRAQALPCDMRRVQCW